jgi:hypothetical protein
MLAYMVTTQILEAAMLVCFGISWPVSIFKAIRTRQVVGKSLGFMLLVYAGYLFGLTGKMIYADARNELPEPVSILYLVNGLLVAADIGLYLRYAPRRGRANDAEACAEEAGSTRDKSS